MHSGLLSAVPPTTATWDFLFNWYLFFGTAAAVIVISVFFFFMLRYRAKRSPKPPMDRKPEGWKLVLATALISITVLTAAQYQTFASFGNIEIPSQCTQNPNPCVFIGVHAFQWGWNFTYPSGVYRTGDLVVPVDRIVVLNITSRDAFHSFGIYMLAVKEDAVPGRLNQLWFNMTELGSYPQAIRCYELCGIGHAFMWANFTSVTQADWTTLMTLNQTAFYKATGGT